MRLLAIDLVGHCDEALGNFDWINKVDAEPPQLIGQLGKVPSGEIPRFTETYGRRRSPTGAHHRKKHPSWRSSSSEMTPRDIRPSAPIRRPDLLTANCFDQGQWALVLRGYRF
jgi:hypothetical protein